MKPVFTFALAFLFSGITLFSQSLNDFSVYLEPMTVNNFNGIHSFAFGQANGKIVLIGGRTTGLHLRQPFQSFDQSGNNTNIIVVDPISQQAYTSPLSPLPTAIEEQLQSTNLNHYQDGDYLYIIGGYGYSPTAGDHITYDKLTVVRLDSLVDAVINNQNITPYFRQIQDTIFQNTGGQLEKIGDTFFLVGGQNFTGRYNPMGGPSFTQEYEDGFISFKINDNGSNLSLTQVNKVTDAVNLHRRDYNMLPQIFPDGTYGLTAFSGVFQHNQDLPFLNSVNIDSSGYQVNNNFNQYLNHYHSGKAALYDSLNNKMHSLFLGGMSQYYFDGSGNLVQNDSVPFVTTIGKVTRHADSSMTEEKVGDLPSLLGSGSELALDPGLPFYGKDIIDLNNLNGDTAFIGYLMGGIESSQPNIFWINTGTESWAYGSFFKVYLTRDLSTNISMDDAAMHPLGDFTIFPNPGEEDNVKCEFYLRKKTRVRITIQDKTGRIIRENDLGLLSAGKHLESLEYFEGAPSVYFITLRAGQWGKTKKYIRVK